MKTFTTTSQKTKWPNNFLQNVLVHNEFVNGKKTPIIPLLLVDNNLVSNFRGKVNIFNNFLVQQFQATANNSILPTNQMFYIQNRRIDIDCGKILKLMV